MSQPRAVLIVNAGSRSGLDDFETARDRLAALGLRLEGAYAPRDPGDLPGLVADTIAEGTKLLILGGGDGTVSMVARKLAGTDVTLGLLPLGTANDLAHTLEIPKDLDAACDAIVNGKLVDVDLGVVHSEGQDDNYLNVASIGLAVEVTRALNPTLKKRLGPLAYPVAAVKAYGKHKPFAARLEFPEGDHAPVELDDLLQVAIANGRFYGGGAVAAPDAGIDDHTLDVYAIPRGTARQRLRVARHFLSGAFTAEDHVLHVTTRSVRITTDTEQPVNIDGELSARTPASFGLLRNALKVMVPLASTAATLDE
jgi:diacylglycerol kinase (ATP)